MSATLPLNKPSATDYLPVSGQAAWRDKLSQLLESSSKPMQQSEKIILLKDLVYEEFGNAIMSAIDFSISIVRQPDPKDDRVNVVLSGKSLPYKQY